MSDHYVVAGEVDPEGLARLRRLVGDARVSVIDAYAPGEPLPDGLGDVSVLFAGAAPGAPETLERLDLLQLNSAGFEQLRGSGLPERVRVANASGVNDVPISEWCLMQMLALHRDLPGMLADQRSGTWNRAARYQAELRGMRVGLYGYGGIAQEVARRSRALGLEVWVLTRSEPRFRDDKYDPFDRGPDEFPIPDRWFDSDEKQDFLAGLDVLVLCAPATASTRGFLDAEALGMLPRDALFLNPARAALVDMVALREALVRGDLRGAAIDVHVQYPLPPDHWTWTMPRTIVTPHISGSALSTYCRPRLWDLFCRNVERRLAGGPLLNVVSAADLALQG